jgi:23S rRNA pseudouridine955/2504/2580 synthase
VSELTTISPTEDGIRLKRWVKRHFPKVSEGEFHKICRTGQMRLNSARCKGDEVLRAGDELRLPPFLARMAQKETGDKRQETGDKFSLSDLEKIRRRIICDDPDFVAFDKPAGLAVQGGTGIKKSLDKMAAALFPYDTILPVHRLDKDTSGVIIFAKNQRAAQILAQQFKDKSASKEYLALLRGNGAPKSGIIDNYIEKGRVFDDGESGKRAITKYEVLGALPGIVSWVRFVPKTGRTHQLRIHSAFSLGAPIVGDRLYGRQDTGDKRQVNNSLASLLDTKHLFLFAQRLSFKHPTTNRIITLRAQMPDFMASVAKFLELDRD